MKTRRPSRVERAAARHFAELLLEIRNLPTRREIDEALRRAAVELDTFAKETA